MKKTWLSRLSAFLLAALLLVSASACGPAAEKTNAGGSTPASTAAAPSDESTKPVNLVEKYSPEISLTAWRFLNNGIQFEPGENIANNVYMRMYKEDLGINFTYVWTVPEEQFDQKLNISVASGDLPDIMWLRNKQLIELTENDLLYDLTDLYKNNTSDFTKSILEQDAAGFNSAKVNDRLMAIPYTGSAIDSLQLLYVRTDWLKNLGLEAPKTMQDLLKVAEAFTKNDPDKNNKSDTFGLALTKNFAKITEKHAAGAGFFAGYHGYIRRWVKEDSGNLAYGSIQPQIKTALLQLQDMYKNGLIDKEFGVKDRDKVKESVTSGKVGITYGGMSTPGVFFKDHVLLDPKADWEALPLVSFDSAAATPVTKMPVERYFAVNKNCKHPEAIMKLVETAAEGYARGATPEQIERNAKFGVTASGISTFQYALIGFEPARKNLDAHLNILKAMETKDTSILNAEEMGYYDKIQKYKAGDNNFYGDAHIFGSPSSFDIINRYVESGNVLYDGFYGSLTPTMVEKSATLESMEDEVFTNIIMGQSIGTFDKFVADWKNLGGDQITKEVNEWYAKNKK
jgi:putative aldouronate transport system substrate-binding protein